MTALLTKTAKKIVQIPIELADKNEILREKDTEKINKVLLNFADKFSNHVNLNLVQATVNAYHNKAGKITNFEFHLRLHPVRGKGFMTKVEDKKLMNAVHTAIDKIKHQANHTH